MPQVTANGLQDLDPDESTLSDIRWAAATGGVDAIIAAYDPELTELTDGLILGFRAAGANVTATPTFQPDGFTARTITKRGGSALSPGDIPAAAAEILVRYNLANTRWEMLLLTEPTRSAWASAGGTVNAITATYSPAYLSGDLVDGLLLGFRAAGANTSTVTFSPNGLTARAIVKDGGSALEPGDIPSAAAEVLVRYNLANTRWEMVTRPQTELFKVLEADDSAGGNVDTAQAWFPTTGGVTVKAGQRYFFEGFLYLSRAAGSTSHTTAVLFGGTATISNIHYFGSAKTGDANTLAAENGFWSNAATALVVKAASTSTTEQIIIRVRGYVKINAGGTFIPQYQFSAAPGGAGTAKSGSFFRMIAVAAATKGLWA